MTGNVRALDDCLDELNALTSVDEVAELLHTRKISGLAGIDTYCPLATLLREVSGFTYVSVTGVNLAFSDGPDLEYRELSTVTRNFLKLFDEGSYRDVVDGHSLYDTRNGG